MEEFWERGMIFPTRLRLYREHTHFQLSRDRQRKIQEAFEVTPYKFILVSYYD